MTRLDCLTSPSRPHWDGSRILFDIKDGDVVVPCAISRDALQDISESRCFKTADLLKCFDNARERIEALALGKLRSRPDGIVGRLSLWSDDIEELPPNDAAAAASQSAGEPQGV